MTQVFQRYASALAFPDFRKMWLANLSAQAAAWPLIVARGWFTFEETGSSIWVGAAARLQRHVPELPRSGAR